MKLSRYAVLTMLAFLCSLAVAQTQLAQTVPSTAPAPMTPELHDALTGGISGSIGEVNVGSQSTTQAAAPPIGFNYVHAEQCAAYTPDGVNFFLYFFALEGSVWITNNSLFETTISPACQTGNFVAFHVIDAAGTFNAVNVFTHK